MFFVFIVFAIEFLLLLMIVAMMLMIIMLIRSTRMMVTMMGSKLTQDGLGSDMADLSTIHSNPQFILSIVVGICLSTLSLVKFRN